MIKNFFKPFLDIIENALKIENKRNNYADMIIINPHGQFLILQRANSDDFENNQWCLPGGHIEVRESAIVAAQREAQEETNLTIDFETIEFLREKNIDGGKISYFISSIDELGEKVVLDTTEHQNYAWISSDEIINYDFIFDLGDLLCEVFDVKKVEVESNLLNTEDYLDNAVMVLNKGLDEGVIEDTTFVTRLYQIRELQEKYTSEVQAGKREIIKADSSDNIALDLKEEYKDYVANGFIYNGRLYDQDGVGIAATADDIKCYSQNGTIFNADVYEEVESKTNLQALDPKRKAFLQVLPNIKRYDEYYLRYEDALANQYNSSQNNFKQRRSDLKKTVEEATDILAALNIVKQELQDNIEPLFTVQFEEGRSKVAFLSELEKYINNNPENNIKKISIRDLQNYNDGEFKVEQFKYGSIDNINAIHQKTVAKLQRGKRVQEKLSKALDLGLITDEVYLQATTLLKADDSDKFEGDLDAITLPNDQGEEQDYSEAQLREHAKNTSLSSLETIIKESDNPVLRELAHQEIKRREKEEHIQEEQQEIEKGKDEISKGCLMFYPKIDKEKWNAQLKKLIPENIVEEYEDDPHITILYGFDNDLIDIPRLRALVERATDHNFINYNIEPISIFENEKDVVKFGISDFGVLTQLNTLMKENFPYQSNFPDYKPHITLAYVKKGEGQQFVGIDINSSLEDWGFSDRGEGTIVYSDPNQEKTLITNTGHIIIPEKRTS